MTTFYVDMDETLLHSVEYDPDHLALLRKQVALLESRETLTRFQSLVLDGLRVEAWNLGNAPVIGGEFQVIIRPAAEDFLRALKANGKVIILSYGTLPYVLDALETTGLLDIVDGAYSARDNPQFNTEGPWLLIDDRDWGSPMVTQKVAQIAGEGGGTEDNFVQVRAFEGGTDTDLFRALSEVQKRVVTMGKRGSDRGNPGRVARAYLKAAGWWPLDIDTGGINPSKKHDSGRELLNVFPDDLDDDRRDMVGGDEPADILGDALNQIEAAWRTSFGRKPWIEEILGVFKFVASPEGLEDEGYEWAQYRNQTRHMAARKLARQWLRRHS